MSRRVQGRLRPLSRVERRIKMERNIRRGRPRFGFDRDGKRYSKFLVAVDETGSFHKNLFESVKTPHSAKVLVTAPNGRTAVLEKKDMI